MLILGIFAAGVLVGYRWLPEKWKRANSILQLVCIVVLVFCMGVTLGRRENFWSELGTMGVDSLLLAVIPMAFSALLVFVSTKWWSKRKKKKQDEEGRS